MTLTKRLRVRLVLALTTSSIAVGGAQNRGASAKERFVDAWGLVSFVSFDANGQMSAFLPFPPVLPSQRPPATSINVPVE